MKMKWIVIRPKDASIEDRRLQEIWENVKSTVFSDIPDPYMIHSAQELELLLKTPTALRGCRVLFVAAIGSYGVNLTLYSMLRLFRQFPDCMRQSAAAMIIDGASELYTKAMASELALTLNLSGCTLIGRCLVEGTGSLYNFTVTAKNMNCDPMTAYQASAVDLAVRLAAFRFPSGTPAKILCIHSSNRSTSNTLRLWELVKEGIGADAQVREISLRNGEVKDCAGCSFETCMYYSRNLNCYYGGTIVDEVYPSLEWCDRLVLLCPNYNDALGANLTAMINRLTALFRKQPFYEKQLFALVVSGYSGSDLVQRQLIDSLSMNKGFVVPGHFALTVTANLPGSLCRIDRIEETAKDFGKYISRKKTGLQDEAREKAW